MNIFDDKPLSESRMVAKQPEKYNWFIFKKSK